MMADGDIIGNVRNSTMHFRKWRNSFIFSACLSSLELSTDIEICSGHVDSSAISFLQVDRQESRFLLSASYHDRSICFFDLKKNKIEKKNSVVLNPVSLFDTDMKRPSTSHSAGVSSVQWFSQDNGMFFTASLDETIKLWQANSFSFVHSFHLRSRVLCMSLRPDLLQPNTIAAGTALAGAKLCDLRSGDCSQCITNHTSAVTCLDWSPNNESLIATGFSDGSIKLFDIRKISSRGCGLVMSLDHLQDHTLVSGTSKKHIKVSWSKDSIIAAHEKKVTSVKFSNYGHELISNGNDRKIRRWSALSGALSPREVPGCFCRSDAPHAMELLACGQGAATGCGDILVHPDEVTGDIMLTPLQQQQQQGQGQRQGHGVSSRLLGHVKQVTALAKVGDDGIGGFISGALDGMIYYWKYSNNSDTDDQKIE